MAQSLSQAVSTRFEALTGHPPSRVCLAPGRVNLIGEHIDYNGFGVLPCAVGRFTCLAIGISGIRDDKALCISLASSTTPQFDVVIDEVSSVPKDEHHWSNYVLAAYLGLREHGVMLPRGIQIVVGGNLPQAGGLSSSSSLVVASALGMSSLRVSRQMIPETMLADICMRSEWHVGTAGGGMDQAAIILSKAGFANHIEFNPLRTTSVKLPAGVSFVVANSLARAAKAETVHTNFNKRVFECKLGQFLLRRALLPNQPVDVLEDSYARILSDISLENGEEIFEKIRSIIPSGGVDKAHLLGLIGQEAIEHMLTGRWGSKVWEVNEIFFILNRAIHVFSEAERVSQFISAAGRGDIAAMAAAMNESGRSLAEDYDCSCPELGRLVAVMKKSGCLSARLVGAGFGGSAVGMVPTADVDALLTRMREYYTQELGVEGSVDELCFAFEPAQGAHFTSV